MSNPLFNALGGGIPQGNGPMQMIQQFMQFKQNFKGDPKAEVQKMLQSGQISQQQLNQVQQIAGQFQHMLKGMNSTLQSGQIDVNTQKGDYNYGWKL